MSDVVFVLPIDCDPVPCSSVWNLFCAELFYLGRALLRGCEYMFKLPLTPHTNLHTHFTNVKQPVRLCSCLRYRLPQCWLCCVCGSVSQCLWSIWATTSASANSPTTTLFAPIRSHGKFQSSAGI